MVLRVTLRRQKVAASGLPTAVRMETATPRSTSAVQRAALLLVATLAAAARHVAKSEGKLIVVVIGTLSFHS